MNIRCKFHKHGVLKYIGHLDVMRYFQKTIRRAELDIAYTGGFSPHQIMSFAAPLGVGIESDAEYMDLKMNSIVSCQDVMDRINAASVPEIQILSVIELPEDAGNAMASVAAAEYEVKFREGREPDCFTSEERITKIIDNFINKDNIPFVKETKKGTREVNLKNGIYTFEYNKSNKSINMLLDASSSNNIKPAQVMSVLLSEYNEQLKENALLILRTEVYQYKNKDDYNSDTPARLKEIIPMDAIRE